MKYMLTIFNNFDIDYYFIMTTTNDVDMVSFSAELDNPNYNAFLTSAKLTDEEVRALEPDVWYDFQTEETN